MSKEEFQHQEEYQQLLHSLKGTVEGLLISQVSNVWDIYGGLNRLHDAVEKILKHGCRVFNHDVRFYMIYFSYKHQSINGMSFLIEYSIKQAAVRAPSVSVTETLYLLTVNVASVGKQY
jgi:hypothetical protein